MICVTMFSFLPRRGSLLGKKLKLFTMVKGKIPFVNIY